MLRNTLKGSTLDMEQIEQLGLYTMIKVTEFVDSVHGGMVRTGKSSMRIMLRNEDQMDRLLVLIENTQH